MDRCSWQDEKALPKPQAPKARSGSSNSAAKLPPPAPMMRKSLTVSKEIASAHAYVTGLGYFELYANGRKVSDDALIPNLTLYGRRDNLGPIGVMIRDNFREYRVMYLSYNIRDYLKTGENVIGALLGNGFYNPSSYWCEGYGLPGFSDRSI